MAHGPGDTHIGQPQDFVFLRIVVRLAIAGLAQARQAIDLIFVGRTGQVLAIAEQEYCVGLQSLWRCDRSIVSGVGLHRASSNLH
jgi:hypothetical protein